MPRRDDLHKILILGSGPIVIGQAAEFDYSGVQACKVLQEEGYEVVLVNSNPATIMTDPEFAHATYVEPLLPAPVAQVIERERPDALLPTLGGQTALNLAKALHDDGTLARFGVELIGANYDAIDRAEDRDRFRRTMEEAGLKMPRSAIAPRVEDARAALAEVGLPCIVRPAFTLGGRGGGVARTEAEYRRVVARGLAASPIGQVLLDQSVLGWGEFELEVMRDRNDNVVIVCSIENVDPMGVHTGDSVTADLSTHMKSVGEAMAIGRTFQQAFAKALRSRELDIATSGLAALERDALLAALESPAWDRYDVMLEAFRKGASIEEVRERCFVDPWFLRELRELALAPEAPFAGARSFKAVDTCAAEFEARTPYYYSGWERREAHEVQLGERPSVLILGSGPNRIGQGIEFDYCCVHAAMTVRESGRDAVMINCNPETVSTDYDPSDRLYFEPLTLEDVLGVVDVERPEGVIVQFGGQTPLKLAHGLEQAGVPLLGTSPEAIDLAEDRGRFGALLDRLGYHAPPYATAHGVDEALRCGERVGYPLLVRPSYVLGGRAMEIVYSDEGLRDYLVRNARINGGGREIFLDRFLENAIEVDVDAICDGDDVWIGGVIQHAEEGGGHSGDPARGLPPPPLRHAMLDRIREWTAGIALGLGVVGLLNVQYAVLGGELYVIEANPRASRTVPFVSKAIGIPLAKLACRVMLGARLRDLDLPADPMRSDHVSVKEAVLPFDRFEGADAVLGPEMRSTGEVMGVARDFPTAFAKAQAAAGAALPDGGTAFITVTDRDKPGAVAIAQTLHDLGFRIVATRGTAGAIERMGIPAERLNKVGAGSPPVVDWIERGDVDLVVNTPTGSGARSDGWEIRRAAVARGIPCLTTLSGGLAA